MSFLKINDPAERDRIVEEFLKTKRNIQQNYLSEKLGDIGQQQDLMNLYKPIIDSQSGIAKELGSIKENTIATTNALKALPASWKAIQFPQYPSIEAYEDPVEDVRTLYDDDSIEKYLYQPAADKKDIDTTFGIRSEDNGYYIGGAPITVHDNAVTVAGKTYAATSGLLELLTRNNPDETKYDSNNLKDYKEILIATDALREPGTKAALKRVPTALKEKWEKIIRPFWKEWKAETRQSKSKVGKGVVVIPQDPNALVPMLSLRMASFRAGNTGARNEIVGICDELLRQGAITEEGYKNFMSQL